MSPPRVVRNGRIASGGSSAATGFSASTSRTSPPTRSRSDRRGKRSGPLRTALELDQPGLAGVGIGVAARAAAPRQRGLRLGVGTRGEGAVAEAARRVALVARALTHHGPRAQVGELAEGGDDAFDVARLHLGGPRTARAERDQAALAADLVLLPGARAQHREEPVPAVREAAALQVVEALARELAHLQPAVGIDGERALTRAAAVDLLGGVIAVGPREALAELAKILHPLRAAEVERDRPLGVELQLGVAVGSAVDARVQ